MEVTYQNDEGKTKKKIEKLSKEEISAKVKNTTVFCSLVSYSSALTAFKFTGVDSKNVVIASIIAKKIFLFIFYIVSYL